MIIQLIALGFIVCFIVFSYIKHYTLKTRVIPIAILLITSFGFVLTMYPLTFLTLVGLFLFERLWLILAIVLIIELVTNKKDRTLLIIFSCISIIIYFFLRARI